jgi:glycosyltransferase involved in cell wall biosynthesis
MTAVIIPAYNAGQTIGMLLERLSLNLELPHFIVVDDGSVDDTSMVAAASGALVLRHETNRGKGAALKTGFQYFMTSTQHPFAITMDADLQHDPAEVPQFIAAWTRGDTDIVVGSRSRIGSGMPVERIVSNTITSSLVSARTGVFIKDSQSGFRLIARNVLSVIKLDSDGYEAETELLIKAARKGFRISSIPIATIYGTSKSYMTHWQTTKRFLQVLFKEY